MAWTTDAGLSQVCGVDDDDFVSCMQHEDTKAFDLHFSYVRSQTTLNPASKYLMTLFSNRCRANGLLPRPLVEMTRSFVEEVVVIGIGSLWKHVSFKVPHHPGLGRTK